MRGLLIGIIMAVLATGLAAQPKTVKDLFESPESEKDSTAGTPEAPETTTGSSIANVNGTNISHREFFRILYASAGSRVLKQMIGLEMAKQMAVAEKVEPSRDDLDKEYRRVVLSLGPQKDTLGKTLTFDDRERLLNGILVRRGISFEEFQIGIEQQAYLRAIAKKKIKITEEMVKDEADRTFGRKREVRVIVLQDIKLAEKVFHQLQKGEDFATLAGKYSIDFETATLGGQIGAIGPKETKYPAIVVKTAFGLPVGKFSSPVRVNTEYWIIKIDQETPAMPITLEKVRPQLMESISLRLENQMIEKMQTELFKEARIKVYDNRLSREFNRWLKEIQTNEP